MKHFSTFLAGLALPLLSGCGSLPKPEIGQCIRKDNENYRENVYMVQSWEADGTPEVKDLVTGKTKNLLEYEPKKFRIVDCPK